MNKKYTIFIVLSLVIFTGVVDWRLYQQKNTIKNLKSALGLQTSCVKLLFEENEALRRNCGVPIIQEVTLTAYTPTKEECDEDPLIAASMNPVRLGTVAVSRDLFYSGWVFGRKVYIKGYGIFVINDLTHKRFKNRIDVFFWKKKRALDFGKKEMKVALLG